MTNNQPEAWLYKNPDGDFFISAARMASGSWFTENGWTETPLYTCAEPRDVQAVTRDSCQTCAQLSPQTEQVTARMAAQIGGQFVCRECGRIYRAMTEPDRALREVLRELLPPKLCGESWNLPDSETVSITVTFGALNKARAILARIEGFPPSRVSD